MKFGRLEYDKLKRCMRVKSESCLIQPMQFLFVKSINNKSKTGFFCASVWLLRRATALDCHSLALQAYA